MTFIGQLNCNQASAIIDNTINADVEFRGGVVWDDRFTFLNLGTGNLIFNGTQTISAGGGNRYDNFNTILIKGSSVVTLAAGNTPFAVNGSINGETSSSTFNVSGVFYQATSVEPMATNGIYNSNQGGTSTIGYVFNGNYTIPYGTYNSLVSQGTGTKTFGQDTILTGGFTINGGTFDLSSYAFTVGTTTTLTGGNIVKNNSTGLLLFKGQVSGSIGSSTLQLNTSGIIAEFQNGFVFDVRNLALTAVTGTTLKFTTRNQNLDIDGGNTLVVGADILVSGAITLTSTNQGFTTTGIINGDNVASTFLNLKYLGIRNAQRPMLTGVLTSSATGSTLVYDLSGAQDIAPGTVYNLTLSGSGAKKLLGNVSVTNTYTLTAPATLNSNGFALTNP